jgi:preprotein translocase subunit SecG
MDILLTVLIVIAAVLLILVVLIQNPKGGGIASNFSAGNNIMGVKRTTDFIEKLTWGLAIGIIVLTLGTTMVTPTDSGDDIPESEIQNEMGDDPSPAATQPQPGQQPAEQPAN